MCKRIRVLCCLAAVLLACPVWSPADADPSQDGNLVQYQPAAPTAIQLEPVFSGLSSPIYVTNAHDGTNRLFVVQQGGVIKVAQPGSSTLTTFLDITSRVLSGGERGLLGLAFHPLYSVNGRFFVYYTRG